MKIIEKIYQNEVFLNNSGLSVIPMKDSDLEVYFDSKREVHIINDNIYIIVDKMDVSKNTAELVILKL